MSEETKNELIRLLTSGNSITDEYKEILFPTVNKEYELSYFGKMKREDILKDADGVYEFKKGFGGHVEEYIGDFYLPINWFYYLNKIISKIKK